MVLRYTSGLPDVTHPFVISDCPSLDLSTKQPGFADQILVPKHNEPVSRRSRSLSFSIACRKPDFSMTRIKPDTKSQRKQGDRGETSIDRQNILQITTLAHAREQKNKTISMFKMDY
ncbi:MAG: hypothetical protein CSA50_07145 [Gammaproteobacteria bacterium]|nr:MAG: hypothetical protein CSA50_07145 [Gammaproteobacteria bacterium]